VVTAPTFVGRVAFFRAMSPENKDEKLVAEVASAGRVADCKLVQAAKAEPNEVAVIDAPGIVMVLKF
jgi:hypothetical protein